MASIKGFTASKTQAGSNFGLMEELQTANGYATALYPGDPIAVSTTGFVKRASNLSTIWGVYKGCRYVGTDGKMNFGPVLPASTSSAGGTLIDGVFDSPRILVDNVAGKTFYITADASVTQGLVGRFFEVSLGTGNDFTKSSGFNLKVASATTSAIATSSMARLVSLVNGVDSPVYSSAGGGASNLTNATPAVEVIFIRSRNGTTF